MTKKLNGRFTTDKWGKFMPAHNCIEDAPYYYRDTECVMVEFTTDLDFVLDLMPPELEVIEPASAFMVIETNHWTTIGPYSEAYVGILCTYEGEVYGYVPGVYVTGEASQMLGREIYGFGKKQAHNIELIKHGDGSVEAVVEVKKGSNNLRAIMSPSTNLSDDDLTALPLICLKVIPDVAGGNVPALAQLTTVTFKANALIGADGKAEVYGGSGSMNMNDHSDLKLPIGEVTGCVYCRFNADLPYGSVLKTYTEKDFK